MGSKEVCSEQYWAEYNDVNHCVAHKKDGAQRLKAAIRGANVCRFDGGAAPQVRRKARERIELAADRMARELLNIATEGESEAVKLNAVRDALDRAGLGAKAEVSLEVKPWERLLGRSSRVGLTVCGVDLVFCWSLGAFVLTTPGGGGGRC